MSPSYRTSLALTLPVALLLAACNGDPTCVFTTGCRGNTGGGGPAGTQPAVFPPEGAWISNLPPQVEAVFPQGGAVGADTPIAIRFGESMSAASLVGAFEVVPFDGLNFLAPVAIDQEVLAADGRVLLLFPADPLPPNGYQVRVSTAGTATPTDVTGQELGLTPGQLVGSVFSVPFAQPTDPALVMTFPAEGEMDAGAGGEVLVVFDRALDPTTVTATSFNVVVAGADPPNDPLATALPVEGGVDERVFTWRSVDTAGNRVDLQAGASVDVLLSPSGSRLTDVDGDPLADTTISFQVAPFSAPTRLSLLSSPSDAIGIANLTVDGTEDLALQVDLTDASDGDELELFLFGTEAGVTSPSLVALRRSFTLSGSNPIQVLQLDAADVDLTVGGDPNQPRFADGTLRFGARVVHLGVTSPLRLFDADPGLAGVQDALLDTVPPSVLTLDGSGTSLAAPLSDVRDLVLIGQASEPLRALDVSATSGTAAADNGSLAPMPASLDDGTFLAAPVPLGVLTGGAASFTAIAYDRALNPSAAFSGVFRQRGGISSGSLTPGDALTVEVYDAQTLAPLGGALVAIHADLGDGVSYPLTTSGTSASDGTFTGATDPAASEVIVTVARSGYDLVSFHGVTARRVSLGLEPSGGATGFVQGTIESSDPNAFFLLPALSGRVDDTRRSPGLVRAFPTGACTVNTLVSCPYGPEAVRAGHRGARSYYAGDFQSLESSFDPTLVLQAFCLELGLPALTSGATESATVRLPFLLFDPTIDPSEVPEALPSFTLRTDLVSGVDTAQLDDDPDTTGEPRVTVETSVPGLPGAVAVGPGLAFDQGGGTFTVRAVRPGAVSAAGFFGGRGSVDTDSFVRTELRDLAGNVATARPRMSSIAGLSAGEAFPLDVPVPTSPASGASTGGAAYSVEFPDVLALPPGWGGLYRVVLTDTGGRRWVLWRRDPGGSGSVRARVVDLSGLGSSALSDGTVSLQVEAHAWPGMDPTEFLWSDVEREEELASSSASRSFVQGP